MVQQANPFHELSTRLRRAVRALESGKPSSGSAVAKPAAESRAAIENDDDTLPGWDGPIARGANAYARILCISASDHLMEMANSLESTNSGVFSVYTLGRGVLETAARASYLLDPTIEVRERVQRYINELLHNINESRRLLVGLDSNTEQVTEFEQANGFDITQPKKSSEPWRIDDGRPSSMALAGLTAVKVEHGRASYRFLSSIAHGAEHGLLGLLPREDGATAMLEKRSDKQAFYLLNAVTAYTLMGNRFLDHYGWDQSQWAQAAMNCSRTGSTMQLRTLRHNQATQRHFNCRQFTVFSPAASPQPCPARGYEVGGSDPS